MCIIRESVFWIGIHFGVTVILGSNTPVGCSRFQTWGARPKLTNVALTGLGVGKNALDVGIVHSGSVIVGIYCRLLGNCFNLPKGIPALYALCDNLCPPVRETHREKEDIARLIPKGISSFAPFAIILARLCVKNIARKKHRVKHFKNS